MSWTEDLASLVEDTGIRHTHNGTGKISHSGESRREGFVSGYKKKSESVSLKDEIEGFMKAWGEMLHELVRGCSDIVQQSIVTDDSYIVKKLRRSGSKVCSKLRVLNDYLLPEDRNPIHAWPVIFMVFILAFAVLHVNTEPYNLVPRVKKVYIHPPSASRILLPDGRHMAYSELGVPADRARFSVMAPHSFLSSRLAGIPGVQVALLEEFGVRLISYDLPGFGESDSHPNRNLNSSALDMLFLANSVGFADKFWVLAYSSGSMHAWAALRYIPHRIAGAAMISPMINPYEPSMSKEERSRTWEKWVQRRKLLYFLARRFPKLLAYFYRRSFLSGKHGQIEKWLSLSLGTRDKAVVEAPLFEEFWHRDVEESIRQGDTKPFVEEAVLQVSSWGFNLGDLRVQQKCHGKGFLPWLKSIYSGAECQLTGFPGPVHIWQGMDDHVVPPSMADYIVRVLPTVTLHALPEDGHFSYFFFCDECQRQIFSAIFGNPQGPLVSTPKMNRTPTDGCVNEVLPSLNHNSSI